MPLRGMLRRVVVLLWCWKLLASSEQTEQGSFKKKLMVINTAAAIEWNGCSPTFTRIVNAHKIIIFFPPLCRVVKGRGGGRRFKHARYYYCQAHRLVIQCRASWLHGSLVCLAVAELRVAPQTGEHNHDLRPGFCCVVCPWTVKVEQFNCSI